MPLPPRGASISGLRGAIRNRARRTGCSSSSDIASRACPKCSARQGLNAKGGQKLAVDLQAQRVEPFGIDLLGLARPERVGKGSAHEQGEILVAALYHRTIGIVGEQAADDCKRA